jgi:hypothetical protein
MRSGSRESLYFFAFAAASTTGAKDCMLVLASPSEYATHRSMDDPGPLSPSIAPDGRIAVVCPKSQSPRSICISGSLKVSSARRHDITRCTLPTRGDEPRPWLAWVSTENVVELGIQVDLVSFQAKFDQRAIEYGPEGKLTKRIARPYPGSWRS